MGVLSPGSAGLGLEIFFHAKERGSSGIDIFFHAEKGGLQVLEFTKNRGLETSAKAILG
jgi:hypothetical protein